MVSSLLLPHRLTINTAPSTSNSFFFLRKKTSSIRYASLSSTTPPFLFSPSSSSSQPRTSQSSSFSSSPVAMSASTMSSSSPPHPSQAAADEGAQGDVSFYNMIQSHQEKAAKLSALEEVRTVMDRSTRGVLSTFSETQLGYPSGSMVDFACDADGSPILAISSLALHSKDLLANPKCSLLVARDPEDRTDLVIVVHGDAVSVPGDKHDAIRSQYLERHPGAFWVDFGDFKFILVQPKAVRYVTGVASALLASGEFSPEEYKAGTVDPISKFGLPITSHMNKDHGKDTREIVQHVTSIQVDFATMLDVDTLGFNVKAGCKGRTFKLRIPFPRPAENRKDVKTLIVEMLQAAKNSSGGTTA